MSIRLLENGDQRLLEDGTSVRLLEDGSTGGITGTLAVTLDAWTLSASGTYTPPAITGSLAVTLDNWTLSASGTVAGPGTITGTLAVTLDDWTSTGSGTVTYPTITGTLAVTLDAWTLSASGTASGPVTDDPYPLTVTIREPQAIAIREGRRMTGRITRHRNAERPALAFEIKDGPGALIDFSTGYTFSFKIGEVGGTALLTKTTDITGAATSPNITVTWASGELDMTPGVYLWQLTATTSSADRVYEGTFVILDAIN